MILKISYHTLAPDVQGKTPAVAGLVAVHNDPHELARHERVRLDLHVANFESARQNRGVRRENHRVLRVAEAAL